MSISVSMITLNEEKKIERTLQSIYGWVDEIVIVDSGSTDKTIQIAEKYGAKIYKEEWKGFGEQKNSAIAKCTCDYLFLLDADEVVSQELKNKIISIISDKSNKTEIFKVKRISYWFGKKTIEKDYVERLIIKGKAKYNLNKVHETLIYESKALYIDNPIYHYTYETIEEYFMKFNKYTTYAAEDLRKKGRKFNYIRLFLEPFRNFIKEFFIRKTIMDGLNGLFRAVFSAMYSFVRYSKLHYIEQHKPNIIISRTDKLGDLILSLPAIAKLRDMYNDAEITFLVKKYSFDLVKDIKEIDRIIVVDEYEDNVLLKMIKSLNPDIFIALYSDKKIMKLAYCSKAKKRIGAYSKLLSWFVYNYGVIQKRSMSKKNEAEYNLDLIKKIDYKKFNQTDNKLIYLKISEEYKNNAEKYFLDNKIDMAKKTIIIHPFSAGSAKNLSSQQYFTLIQKIANKGINVIITCAISDEVKICEYKIHLKELKNCYFFINSSSIMNLAALINKVSVFIGSSTGPTHIAGLLGIKTIAIFSQIEVQSIKRWGMYKCDNVYYIIPEKTCTKKYKCNVKCKNYNCFESIDINKIVLLC